MMTVFLVAMPFLYGLILYGTGRKEKRRMDPLAILFVLLTLAFSVALFFRMPFENGVGGIFPYGLSFTCDGFRAVYSLVTSVMWTGCVLFSKEYFEHEPEHLERFYLFLFFTLGATQGVMLSADLMTTFVFFEILSFTSYTWVLHEETKKALRAAETYLYVAVIGGLALFMGLLLMKQTLGTLRFDEIALRVGSVNDKGMLFAAGLLVLLGFGAKAGMFPVHIWLPKAHPVAPSPASALLSGILTKVGIYGILMTTLSAFTGNLPFAAVILALGAVTMFLGALLALFSVDLKRTLACSSMSQIGFILTGIGMTALLTPFANEEGIVLATGGTVLHMVNHSMIKLVLFLCSGVFVMRLHSLDLNEIRGFGRKKRGLLIAFALGAVGISGIPLLNGYLSKTLLHEAIVFGWEEAATMQLAVWLTAGRLLRILEWIFLVTGGLTFAYMLKLFICIFVERHPKRQAEYDADKKGMSTRSLFTILGAAVLLILLGVAPFAKELAYLMTGHEEIRHFHAFSLTNLKGALISLLIGAVVYLVIVRGVLRKEGRYLDRWPASLDLEDLLYRPVLTGLLPRIGGAVASVFGENKVLIPLAVGVFRAAGVFAAILANLFDALIYGARYSFVKEKGVVRAKERRFNPLTAFRKETEKAAAPIVINFSFALIMTCIGIIAILIAIILSAII